MKKKGLEKLDFTKVFDSLIYLDIPMIYDRNLNPSSDAPSI